MGITIEREYRTIDKSSWGEGPWNAEPDKIQGIDEETGYPVLAVRVPWNGALCGYVGVTEEHPTFGLSYDEVDKFGPEEDNWRGFRVHGGLTFAGPCQENAEETGICHMPNPGQPDHVHWFGFDMAHCDDICPATEAKYKFSSGNPWAQYRTLEYVLAECSNLARQLKQAEG